MIASYSSILGIVAVYISRMLHFWCVYIIHPFTTPIPRMSLNELTVVLELWHCKIVYFALHLMPACDTVYGECNKFPDGASNSIVYDTIVGSVVAVGDISNVKF